MSARLLRSPDFGQLGQLALWVALCLIPQQSSAQLTCSPEFARALDSPEVLRALADKCGDDAATFAAAIKTLNSLPPPTPPRLTLRPTTTPSAASRTVLETELYYFMYQAYPHPEGLRKLSELLETMMTAFAIERIEVTGFLDLNEAGVPGFDVSKQRAEFVRKFFVAAGVPENSVTVATSGPSQPDTVEGRARDRSTSIRVVMFRERPAGAVTATSRSHPTAQANASCGPFYPAVSQKLGEAGVVVVKALVQADGVPAQVHIERSSGYERLDKAALDAVSCFRYKPGMIEGAPTAMWVNVPVRFQSK